MLRTITALASPPGIGGLAVIRISGDQSIEIADRCFAGKHKLITSPTHTIRYGKILHNNEIIDNVTVSIYKAPNSYTGEDVVEIGCHGGMLISSSIIDVLIAEGAFIAQPGEFTKRAFINGKLDLAQVEAVADIIHSVSIPGVQTAARQLNGDFTIRLKELRLKLLDIAGLLELELDFSDEGLEFIPKDNIIIRINEAIIFCTELVDSFKSSEILRSGYYVGIAGFPNSGKSTLFNTLLGRKRAIVSNIPGTTRDYIEESIFINGLTIKLVDTAGIRDTSDFIEIEGIKFVDSVLEQSNMIIIINDITNSDENTFELYNKISTKYQDSQVFLVHNKIDLVDNLFKNSLHELYISASMKNGINELKDLIYENAKSSTNRINDILINSRHAKLLNTALIDLHNALDSILNNMENEYIAVDIRKTIKTLGELTGESWNEEVLEHIFSKFCIGK
jgi:tRNA modification GTPase